MVLYGLKRVRTKTFRVCTTTCLNEPKHTKPQLGRSATLTIHYFQIKVQNKRLNTSVQNEDSPFEQQYFHRFHNKISPDDGW